MLTTPAPVRLAISEYGEARSLSADAHTLGMETSSLRSLLEGAATRLSRTLAVESPINFEGDGWNVQDVAGLLRLSPSLELEIAPKFLRSDTPSWREDFFAVATLARFGRILPREALRAGVGERGDLADLIGHAITEMYDRNRTRPLWIYRHRTWRGFDVDGELDPESVFLPDEGGFEQSDTLLDRQNAYNWVIHRAIESLLPEIRNGDVRRRLAERRAHLSPQREHPRGIRRRFLPSRHRRWQNLYDLSHAVLNGFGVAFAPDRAITPGYVLKTADAWESLLLAALRSGLPDCTVTKKSHPFGQRVRLRHDGGVAHSRVAEITPDATITFPDGSRLPVDAKYKGRAQEGWDRLTISASDLYESVAFMSALNVPRIALVYPWPGEDGAQTGDIVEFEHIWVGEKRVVGLAANVCGISRSNGFARFALGLCTKLKDAPS